MAKEAIMLALNQAAEKPGYNRPAPIAQMARMPRGGVGAVAGLLGYDIFYVFTMCAL